MDTASNGVEITEKISYQKFILYILIWQKKWALALKKLRMPRLYLINGNGVLNAFAAKMLFTQTLCCHSQ